MDRDHRPRLTVLDGSRPTESVEASGPDRRDWAFLAGWATDTRLMGVVCLSLTWAAGPGETVRQFFYLDWIAYGFDRFEEVAAEDGKRVRETEASFAGGLGGRKIPVTLREAVFLVREAVKLNDRLDLPLPEEEEKYAFLLEAPEILGAREAADLFGKISVSPRNEEECGNYYLMRCCDRDRAGMAFLGGGTNAGDPLAEAGFGEDLPMTFYQNDMERQADGSWLTRSLISDQDNAYYLLRTRMSFRRLADGRFRTESCQLVQSMGISGQEAWMNLLHPEYIGVYRLAAAREAFGRSATPLMARAVPIEEENGGVTWMIYRQDNDHVQKVPYHLYDDLVGLYHLTPLGQLVAVSHSNQDRLRLGMDLGTGELADRLALEGSYAFSEPVMNLFLESGEEDFSAFLATIGVEE